MIISSTYLPTISKVFSPGDFTAIPSAMVFTSSNVILSPLLILSYIEGAPVACTPIIFIFGLMDLATKLIPLIRPPPPTGHII